MKKIQLALLLLFFLNCNLFAQQSNNKNRLTYKNDSIITANGMKFKFRYSEYKDELKTLVNIYVYTNDKLTQTINSNEYVESYHQEKLIDYNFDGINDISVCTSCGSGGCLYQVWLYSSKDKKYHYAKELSDRYGLEVDAKRKLIIFSYWGGVGNEFSDTFHYVNGKLRPIH